MTNQLVAQIGDRVRILESGPFIGMEGRVVACRRSMTDWWSTRECRVAVDEMDGARIWFDAVDLMVRTDA